jgi:hypothetical protein
VSKKLFFQWFVTVEVDEPKQQRHETLFQGKEEITEQEMLQLFKEKKLTSNERDGV